jgi:hypothetical protein
MCADEFGSKDGEVFCADGVFICDVCAERQKRRWTFVLPAMVLGVVAVGAMSAIGLLLGDPINWSFMGWEIPTLVVGLLPVTVLGSGLAMRLGLGKGANRTLLQSEDSQDLLLGTNPELTLAED